jgi:predicted CxxxxCH...CXXCH cytochrome family protein
MRALPRVQAAATVVLALGGCTRVRNPPADLGQHPDGWVDPASASFHARWLRANGDALDGCRTCHGADYQGGPVGVSCTSQGCHTQPNGPEFCGTCHGGPSGPLPATGAHALHAPFCRDCHDVPKTVDAPGHIAAEARVVFSGLAVAGGAKPVWNASNKQCAGAYCHSDQSPTWQAPATVTCDACHGTPPASHQRWSRVATPGSCATCHPVPPASTHVDGTVELAAGIACDTCHGHGPLGAPAPALDGSTDPASRGVGAHQAHLDEALPNRIGHVAACETCHPVPASVTTPGHLDQGVPTAVDLPDGGTYDPGTRSCVVGCHWSKTPGPAWTDTSGAALACDACHGFPPVLKRDGTPHTASAPTLSACLACHPFSPATHVDGLVELVP